jgi:hypothetical protein
MDERADLMREICVCGPTDEGDDAVLGRGWKRWRIVWSMVNGA